MESLTRSSLKGVCLYKVLDKHRGLSLCSKDVFGLSKKQEICFLGLSSSKIVHISSFSAQHKTIMQPISCAPDSQTHTQREETETTDTNQSKPVRVKFQLNKECSFGQHFNIVGDDTMLGSWDPINAVPLEWSEGHVWNVELDIPSGKTISYKFTMKVDDETIVWQQGPDRILQTWETKNTITVTEDWDNAELQTIVEEEPGAISPEILIAENLAPLPPTVVDLENDVNEEKTNDILAIVAENITEVNGEVNTDLNEDTTMEAKAIGKNATAFNDEVLSTKNESILVADEKSPVLVPGLTQVFSSEVHGDKVVAESSLGSYSEEFNVLNEVHMDKVVVEYSVGSESEEVNVTELSLNEEVATNITHPRETPEMMMLNVKQEVTRGNEDIEKSDLVGGGDWSNGKSMEENVFGSDIQWGKKTLLKFFAGLGFFKVELEG
ncbi:hypothetical protein K7X08_000328 [Anisodus acutangulus]|uniref:CBM20 domain-containing protein n=1 Tax=Anisodus acutangulus TaxID=402998 RepID=A0A9Q1RAV3_9SOLA|nr:hypothetical protein K7X08_000328 [Anisodus acutangulus]